MENKPTLEEVKEYFKNAKEVRCICDDKIYSLENMNEKGIYEYYNSFWFTEKDDIDVCIWDFKFAKIISYKDEQLETPNHYDNSKGSLYQFCENQNLNSYEFDIIKRVMRCRKKGNFKEDLEKTKFLIDLYLKEYEQK